MSTVIQLTSRCYDHGIHAYFMSMHGMPAVEPVIDCIMIHDSSQKRLYIRVA